jgi:hypothetical protein
MKLMLIKRTDSFYKTQRFPKSFNSSTNWFEFCTVGFTEKERVAAICCSSFFYCCCTIQYPLIWVGITFVLLKNCGRIEMVQLFR